MNTFLLPESHFLNFLKEPRRQLKEYIIEKKCANCGNFTFYSNLEKINYGINGFKYCKKTLNRKQYNIKGVIYVIKFNYFHADSVILFEK